MVRERNQGLDLVCGLLILHMIWIHLVGIPTLTTYVFFYFMFWFFYKTGMFYRKGTCLKDQIKKDTRRLLVPFGFFSLAAVLMHVISGLLLGKFSWSSLYASFCYLAETGSFRENAPCWFLLSLFFTKLIYNVTSRKIHDAVIVAGGILSAWLLYVGGVTIPYVLGNVSIGLACLAAGHALKGYQQKTTVVVVAWGVFLLITCTLPSYIDVWKNSLLEGDYLLAVPYAFAGIVIINSLATALPQKVFKNSIVALLTHIGKNSMCYLVCHWPLIYIGDFIAIKVIGAETGTPIQLVLMTVMLPVLDYLFHRIPGGARLLGE